MQAIVTKFIGPTSYRPARIKASAQAGSVTVSWDNSIGVEGNHDAAMRALLAKLGWSDYPGTWHGGGSPDGTGYVYVFVRRMVEPRSSDTDG